MYDGKRFKYNGHKIVEDTHDREFCLDEYYSKSYCFADSFQAEAYCNKSNEMQLQKERAEAKIRAMKL